MDPQDRIPLLISLRREAREGLDPTCSDGTLTVLLGTAAKVGATDILEIGAGVGLTSAALVLRTQGRVTAIENDPARIAKARENFARFGVSENITLLCEDASAVLPRLQGQFDLIFLDGPKVQYRKYFPHCKRLLKRGGALVADDVFFLGEREEDVPKKRRMLFLHLAEFRDMLRADPDFQTKFYTFDDGVSVSIKR